LFRTRRSPAAASWAGRITIPEPFSLTNSMNMDSVHRRKCMHEIEAAKLQKEVDEELSMGRPFKAQPVPAHVHMPLYEKLQAEQHVRSEQVRQLTRDYLTSIQKPFGFDSREKAKKLIRRHSYSGGDILRPEPQFKAKPLPDFYHQSYQENEQYKFSFSLFSSVVSF
jgi:protein FAM161A